MSENTPRAGLLINPFADENEIPDSRDQEDADSFRPTTGYSDMSETNASTVHGSTDGLVRDTDATSADAPPSLESPENYAQLDGPKQQLIDAIRALKLTAAEWNQKGEAWPLDEIETGVTKLAFRNFTGHGDLTGFEMDVLGFAVHRLIHGRENRIFPPIGLANPAQKRLLTAVRDWVNANKPDSPSLLERVRSPRSTGTFNFGRRRSSGTTSNTSASPQSSRHRRS